MTMEQALKIVDPATCYEALAPYAGDCDMLHATASEACRMVADICKAALHDLIYVAKTSQDYECSCALCAAGLGSGSCDWPDGVDMPTDCCEKCEKCVCSRCVDKSEWQWRGPGGGT